MTSTDTLLPCPFCGGDARLHDNKQELCVLCYGCEMEVFGNTADECVAAWNRRTPPTPATEEREAVAQWCSGCHEVRSVDCYRAGCPKSDTEEREAVARAIRTFKCYRPNVPDTHDENQKNAPDEVQFEGVEFSDGVVVLRWRTTPSTSVWSSMGDMMKIHGHPEYGTVIEFSDDAARAAEILAAEENERARIVASLRATSTGLDLTKRRIADAIERNEHRSAK